MRAAVIVTAMVTLGLASPGGIARSAGTTGASPEVAAKGNQTGSSEIPEVVVSSEQPGPGLWKVSSGDHVLWVFGTIGVLPKHMPRPR
jgi:hypothetical protein